jgi:hypothetical protein
VVGIAAIALGMGATRLTDLPPNLAAAVRLSGAELPLVRSYGRPEPVINDAKLREWLREFSDSGALATAIEDLAANDPDLAG